MPSEGLTVNKSQGSTYDEVTVSLYRECEFKATKAQLLKNPNVTVIRNMYIDRCSLYVAASRVKKRSGLKLIGKFKEPPFYTSKHVVNIEYKRLKSESPLQFRLTFPEEHNTDCLRIIVHNIQSLVLHLNVVKKDILYQSADVLCLYETWSPQSYNFNIDGYSILKRIDNSPANKAQGMIIYIKNYLFNENKAILICSNSHFLNNNYILIECLMISNTFLIIIYKSPKSNLMNY